MRAPVPVRRRYAPRLPIQPRQVPLVGGAGVVLDFGAVFHQLEVEELLRELGLGR